MLREKIKIILRINRTHCFSKTETILATNEDSNPKALINKPIISSAFNFNNIITKYIKIEKLIICEKIVNPVPIFILL